MNFNISTLTWSNCFMLILQLFFNSAKCEWFSSLGQMEDLLENELDFMSKFTDYVAKEKKRIEKLSNVLEALQNETIKVISDRDTYLSHPINQLHLMKRLTTTWPEIANTVEEIHSNEFSSLYKSKVNYLPNEDDLRGSRAALLRLQSTYKLDVQQLIQGSIKNVGAIQSLSVEDCFHIGQTAYLNQDYYHCTLWMKAILERMDITFSPMEKFDVMDHLAFCMAELHYYHEAINITNEMLKIEPNHTRLLENLRIYRFLVSNQNKIPLGDLDVQPPGVARPYFREYERLCRGTHQPLAYLNATSHLKCYYWTNHNHPRLLLQPIKSEELWDSPHVIRFYDVVSDDEVTEIKKTAKPLLNRATVFNLESGKLEHAHYRVSKSAWLNDEDYHLAARLSQRISDVTGLSMDSAESLQVANYGVGGQYEPHFDYHRDENVISENGNRIATFLIYLSDVDHGGSTVFIHPQISVQPIKGSAVFWYNLHPSGVGDWRTRHAACPVLVGNKWVANKWIHEHGQEFRRPCSLNEEDTRRIL